MKYQTHIEVISSFAYYCVKRLEGMKSERYCAWGNGRRDQSTDWTRLHFEGNNHLSFYSPLTLVYTSHHSHNSTKRIEVEQSMIIPSLTPAISAISA
jgi:hypothetical protein